MCQHAGPGCWLSDVINPDADRTTCSTRMPNILCTTRMLTQKDKFYKLLILVRQSQGGVGIHETELAELLRSIKPGFVDD